MGTTQSSATSCDDQISSHGEVIPNSPTVSPQPSTTGDKTCPQARKGGGAGRPPANRRARRAPDPSRPEQRQPAVATQGNTATIRTAHLDGINANRIKPKQRRVRREEKRVVTVEKRVHEPERRAHARAKRKKPTEEIEETIEGEWEALEAKKQAFATKKAKIDALLEEALAESGDDDPADDVMAEQARKELDLLAPAKGSVLTEGQSRCILQTYFNIVAAGASPYMAVLKTAATHRVGKKRVYEIRDFWVKEKGLLAKSGAQRGTVKSDTDKRVLLNESQRAQLLAYLRDEEDAGRRVIQKNVAGFMSKSFGIDISIRGAGRQLQRIGYKRRRLS